MFAWPIEAGFSRQPIPASAAGSAVHVRQCREISCEPVNDLPGNQSKRRKQDRVKRLHPDLLQVLLKDGSSEPVPL